MGSRRKYETTSHRVLTYLKARGFQVVDATLRETLTSAVVQAPGKWSGLKTDWIVARVKANSSLGIPFRNRHERDPLPEVFEMLETLDTPPPTVIDSHTVKALR